MHMLGHSGVSINPSCYQHKVLSPTNRPKIQYSEGKPKPTHQMNLQRLQKQPVGEGGFAIVVFISNLYNKAISTELFQENNT